jgi:hypothetical protein
VDPKQLSIKTWKLAGSIDERLARIEAAVARIEAAAAPAAPEPEPPSDSGPVTPEAAADMRQALTRKDRKHG